MKNFGASSFLVYQFLDFRQLIEKPLYHRFVKKYKMKLRSTQKMAKRITGISLVLMTVLAGIVMTIFMQPIFDKTILNQPLLANYIIENFHYSVLIWILICVLDGIVSWGLYRSYSNKKNAKTMAAFRWIYTFILGFAILNLFSASHFTIDKLILFSEEVKQFQSIWQIGLIIFGLHLIFLSKIVCNKSLIQKTIAILLLIAGIGYIVTNLLNFFYSDYLSIKEPVEGAFMIPMIFGELGLAVYLLFQRKSSSSLGADEFDSKTLE